jgi:hypothetical protein
MIYAFHGRAEPTAIDELRQGVDSRLFFIAADRSIEPKANLPKKEI